MTTRILIVEDEFIVANALRLAVEKAGYHVTGIVASVEEANEHCQKQHPDLVLLDIRLEGKSSGIDLARKLKDDNIPFIYLSANSSQQILEAAKATEPYGFLVKPFREKDLLVTLDIALYRHRHSQKAKSRQEDFLQKQLNNKHSEAVNVPAFQGIIGNHPLLLAALDLTRQVAPYNTSVLILGESGTGKEKVAQHIHTLSQRAGGPFVKVNCAAIPATLMESDLFGHEKGAFTGAHEKRKGRFEQADGGTIFLDEIGELPLDMQVKLLRVLQEKEITYVGGDSPIKVNVRIIAATNRNLEKEVATGNFRLDLYYRLNVFPITLPALRERKTDIEALALFFANRFCREFNKSFAGIATSMMEEMYTYSWPGNIRELENVMEQAVILNDGTSQLELKRNLTSITPALPGNASIETLNDVKLIQQQTERAYLISMLKKANGRIRGTNGAAALLNIKPTTLEAKMAKLNIKKHDL